MVREKVEEMLNAMLDEEAEQITKAIDMTFEND